MNRKNIIGLAMAGVIAASAAVVATVTFDPNTGTGFVGKGDVQTPFGWNNATAQAESRNVAFSYDVTEEYDVTIEFDTGNRNITHHTVIQEKNTSVVSTVASDPRRTGQYTGWILNGFGATNVTGSVPVVGDSCPNGNTGTCVVTAVTLVSTTGGLFVSDAALGKGPTQIFP